MNRSPAACSETARSDLLLSGAARLVAVRLESGKFDPAPAPAETSALVNSGKSAVYETTFGHPVETRSAAFIIPPIASRSGRSLPCSLTQARAGKLSIYFSWNVHPRRSSPPPVRGKVPNSSTTKDTKVHEGTRRIKSRVSFVLLRVLTSCPSWSIFRTSRTSPFRFPARRYTMTRIWKAS